jgi:hypothetical protein
MWYFTMTNPNNGKYWYITDIFVNWLSAEHLSATPPLDLLCSMTNFHDVTSFEFKVIFFVHYLSNRAHF